MSFWKKREAEDSSLLPIDHFSSWTNQAGSKAFVNLFIYVRSEIFLTGYIAS